MKKFCKSLISVILAAAMFFTFSMTANATTPSRRPGKVSYLSDVAIIEAASDEEAEKIFNELQNQTGNKFAGKVDLDLNTGGSKKVYLAYATSDNVDDAITDLAVMNMEGNFSMGNYEQLLAATMAGYIEVANDYRTMAEEFTKNYNAGNENAKLAYRQMNYYYLEEGGQKINMGDYILNFPEKNDGFASILFRGNLNIIANLRGLLAMGMGIEGTTLKGRIADAYAKAETDPSVYTNAEYEKIAEAILDDIKEMKKNVNNLSEEIEAVDQEEELDKEDREILKQTIQNTLDMSKAFLELLKEIPKGDTTLGDYVMDAPVLEAKDFFPIVAAGSEAEVKAMEYGSLYALLLYDVLEKDITAIEASLEEIEAEIEPMSVFFGVQNDLVSGTIGVTGNAEAAGNATGESVMSAYGEQATNEYSNKDKWMTAVYSLSLASGVGLTAFGIGYLIAKESAAHTTYEGLLKALSGAEARYREYTELATAVSLEKSWRFFESSTQWSETFLPKHIKYTALQSKAEKEIAKLTDSLGTTSKHMTVGQGFLGGLTIAAGVVVMGLSIWQIVEIHNKYKIEYTDIPNNMVDVVSTQTGDRFINYVNVPSYYMNKGQLATRANDMNAYNGLQWVSLYYTKHYEAGYCLTVTPDLAAKEEVKTGYSPIHLFGRKTCYNLNAYCNRKNAESVYLAFKYSANKKSAETDVPTVVGTIINSENAVVFVVLSGVLGIGIGAGSTVLIKRKTKEPKPQ